MIWEQTKQQLNEQQRLTGSASRRLPEETKYNAQRVENLKKSFIQILKHSSNIRGLQPEESVTIRITETAVKSSSKASIKAIINNDQYLVQTETGIKLVSGKESLADFIKFLPQNAIVIRAKKSDIDSFAKDELDFDKFREKVQIFSYPVLNGNSETIK